MQVPVVALPAHGVVDVDLHAATVRFQAAVERLVHVADEVHHEPSPVTLSKAGRDVSPETVLTPRRLCFKSLKNVLAM